MKTRILGRTGLKVSEIGFGAWAVGGNAHGNSYGPTDDAESIAAVRRAAELGVNFIDTADVYGWGHSEEILGEALEGHREDVHIATKVGGDFYHGGVRMNFDPGYIAFALERTSVTTGRRRWSPYGPRRPNDSRFPRDPIARWPRDRSGSSSPFPRSR